MTNLVPSKQYPVWVEYWEPDEPHGHLLLIKSPDESISMQELLAGMEGFASELAEMFHRCGNQDHGKGIKHDTAVVTKAYDSAIAQLLTMDYEAEWEERQRQIRVYEKWGGQPPAIFMQPKKENAEAWEAIIPDKEGEPYVYDIDPDILGDMLDPREVDATPNELGGWTIPEE